MNSPISLATLLNTDTAEELIDIVDHNISEMHGLEETAPEDSREYYKHTASHLIAVCRLLIINTRTPIDGEMSDDEKQDILNRVGNSFDTFLTNTF